MRETRDVRGANLFDSGDAEARIKWLEEYINAASNAEEIEDLEDEIRELEETRSEYTQTDERYSEITDALDTARAELAKLIAAANDIDTDDEEAELEVLKALKEEVSEAYWDDGVAFICDDYFEDYAREYAEGLDPDIRTARWPFNHIDWTAAADELKVDYSFVDFDGETYWYRAG